MQQLSSERSRYALILACALGAGACGAPESEGDVATSEDALLGSALRGIDAADFEEAKETFAAEEEIDEGLGPIFNEHGCGVAIASVQ